MFDSGRAMVWLAAAVVLTLWFSIVAHHMYSHRKCLLVRARSPELGLLQGLALIASAGA